MAFLAVLESDLRALSAEARRRYPAVKDGAEHAILKLRSLSSPSEIAHNEDILQIFLIACEVRTVKLSVIGLSCLQKLISHDAVAPSASKEILATLKDLQIQLPWRHQTCCSANFYLGSYQAAINNSDVPSLSPKTPSRGTVSFTDLTLPSVATSL